MEDLEMQELLEELKQNIEDKKYGTAARSLSNLAAVEAAELMSELDLSPAGSLIIFRLLQKDFSAEVFAFLDVEQQRDIAMAVSTRELMDLIQELAFDDRIDFIEEMPSNLVTKILTLTDPAERALVNQFLNYPEHSAGSLMTIEYVHLREKMTVREAIAHVRLVGEDMETVYSLFITSADRKLTGVISLRELLIADDDMLVGDLAVRNVIYVHTTDDQEEVADLFRRYDFLTVPVVDHEERMVGIITVDDILDVVDIEATEDIHKMAAIMPTEEDYSRTTILQEVKSRFFWLLILMIGATFTGSIISRYENILLSMVVLSSFIPMLMDTAGNAGSQSSTIIIRSLSMGTIKPQDILKIVWKELRISIVVGIALATVNYLRIVFLLKMSSSIALVVSFTQFLVICMAKMLGGSLPILAKSLGLDPAVMASPMITTIVDTLALIAYFNIASRILHM